MAKLPYQWARVEQVDGASLVRLSDNSLALPGDVVVTDLETGHEPVDEDGKKRAIVSASDNHIEFYVDPYVVDDVEELVTVHLAGRYSVSAKPLEFD